MTSDPHFFALIVPVPAVPASSARNRRRREAAMLKQAREVRVDGMALEDFHKLNVTGQFIHLRRFIPGGWRPVDFKEAPADVA